jgi:WD40 repeat protein
MVLLLDKRICSVCHDGSVKIWNVDTEICELTVQVSSNPLYKVILLHDDRLVVSNYFDKTLFSLG